MKKVIIGLILVMLLVPVSCAAPAPAPETVTFPDENLEAAIREALGKSAGEAITPAELVGLTQLAATMQGITDLSRIEYCTNLTWLYLEGNEISDLSPLVENSGLDPGDIVILLANNLDLSEGSEDLKSIRQLEGRGVVVHY